MLYIWALKIGFLLQNHEWQLRKGIHLRFADEIFGHWSSTKTGQILKKHKKPLTSWYVFMVFFQITSTHEDDNANGLVSAPVTRIERRKTKGKYIAWTMETSVRVQLMYYRRSLWRYWMNPDTISPHVATISPYMSQTI